MSQLKIILIDVAWGDSIFLESIDSNGNEHYALIDSNDTTNFKSSLIFLKRYFQRKFNSSTVTKPVFDWVMLSHAHLDHGEGLKEIMKFFGTSRFYYPKSILNSSLAHLQNYANRARIRHQAIDNNRNFPNFGDARVKIHWPNEDQISNNENDNSIVMSMNIHDMTCMLTGDAEEEVWNAIKSEIPNSTVFFKVPHHGSSHGTLDHHGNGTWTTNCPTNAFLAMSTHNRPYNHPDNAVLTKLDSDGYNYARTDNNYHVEILIDSNGIKTKYSR